MLLPFRRCYNDSATDAAIIVPIGLVLGDVEVTGDGREAERCNRCRTNGQIPTLYPPQSPIPQKSFGDKYVRLPEVESGRPLHGRDEVLVGKHNP